MHTVNPQVALTPENIRLYNEAMVNEGKETKLCTCGRPVNGKNEICYICFRTKTGGSVADYVLNVHITIDTHTHTISINGNEKQIYDPAIREWVQKMVFLWSEHKAEKIQPTSPKNMRYYEYTTTQAALDYADSIKERWFTPLY